MRSTLVVVLALAAVACRRDPPPPGAATAASGTTGAAAASAQPSGGEAPGSKPAGATASSAASSAEAPGKPIGTYVQGNDGVTRMTISGLEIEVAADVPDRSKDAPKGADGDNQVVVTLRGWPIQVREGQLYVAGKAFGDAPAGSRVRLAKDGVYVGGELRGALP